MAGATEIASKDIAAALQGVSDEKSFLNVLLAETLNWPVQTGVTSVGEITYEWSKAELRARDLDEKLVGGRILQLQLTHDQPWGIFLLEFNEPDVFTAERGMTGVLRQVLRGLVPSRRKDPSQKSWRLPNLLFICTHGYEHFRVAHFKAPDEDSRTARLAAFGWGPDTPARTACEFNLNQLGWPDDPTDPAAWIAGWSAAFDVEKVTKRFYADYAAVDRDMRGNVAKAMSEEDIDAEPVKLFTQTLLNRLMFLRFIERKRWLHFPAAAEAGDYLRDLYAAGGYRGKSFYVGRLRRLFFKGLAVEGEQRAEAIGKVPFLNGGLFEEKAGVDDLVDDLPDDAFAPLLGPDGLFYRYNFTVEESTPLNVEVAVDPEMLGKVFEELVTGRHESGSYYTPRPIVSFMCRETLKNYLANVTRLDEDALGAFVDRHETPFGIGDAKKIAAALDDLKAVDPACGSGAYLLGLLHEMVDLYRLLYSDKLKADDRSLHDLKLGIISNCIYGVDIDPFATNIAMLRLWLSLSVDSSQPLPLPNLEFKIGTGDSLAGSDPSAMPDLFREKLQRDADELIKKKDEYLNCHDRTKHERLAEVQLKQELLAKALQSTVGEGVIDWRIHFAEVFAGKPARATIDGRFAFANEARGAQRTFTEGDERGGFDVVLANPPYVRQELIKDQKLTFRANFPDIYSGAADLCCYFYGRAIQLLRPGGTLAFISSNKWMRAGYGRNLRSFLLRNAAPKTIVDFGHSPIFPQADTFPCVPVLTRRKHPLANGERPPDTETFAACIFPREDYRPDSPVGPYVAGHSSTIPAALLRDDSWSLEDPRTQRLLERMRSIGVTLKQFCGSSPLYGVKSGLNEAFYIDKETRERLINEDERSADIIKPLLRGRDIDRWRPRRSSTFIIFARRGIDIGSYPAIKRHLSQYRRALEKRAGEQAWYELQASPGDDFARVMFQPKIVYQEIQFHSWFSLETEGACVNNKVFLLPTDDLALLGVLSSPLMWWFLTRTLPHMKDEALCPAGFLMENIRVTTGTAEQAADIRQVVERLIALADASHQWQEQVTADVCKAVGVDEPDGRIVSWLSQSPDVFNARVAKVAGRKNLPEALAATLTAFHNSGRDRQVELLRSQLELEQRLATLVEDAFGLTDEERELLRATRSVRDPLDVLRARISVGSRDVERGLIQ